MLRTIACASALAFLLNAQAAHAATVRGTSPRGGVVWVSDGSQPERAEGAMITQRLKAFAPVLSIVAAGSTVRFRNDDEVDHSVYSVSVADPFDLGIYEPGPGKDIVFPAAGVVEIRCHIHRHMRATLVVVDGPSTRIDAPGGVWKLTNVRPGRHTLHVWNAESGEISKTIDVR